MNRRKTEKANLGMGHLTLLVAVAVLLAGAGVFHVYVKNRQIKVSRQIQAVEERISQYKLDITNLEVRLDDQLNPILINDRLTEMSSDLRRIPLDAVKEVSPRRLDPVNTSSGRVVTSRPPPAGTAPVSAMAGSP